ncbi:MAG: fluoride efflux transporter CrcB [Burkholderiales bacterium]|jgi:CrcB protein|nr:fluoride efflux transporter CrcB [Burkholderiales bacterium]
MFLSHLIAVCLGASIGAALRWGVTCAINEIMPDFPLGTLLCNLVGGFLVGVALAVFLTQEASPHVRLFVITGFLGGLTTFSTFSSEVSMLLLRQQYAIGFLLATTHWLGSILLTIIGFSVTRGLLK